MSTNATFGQAGHTLTVIGQQEPTAEHLKVLHDGYLADLMRVIKLGTVPARDTFQKFLGLLCEFKIWKTVRLGVHKTAEAYEQTLEANGFRITDYTRKILKKISVSQTEIELDLVVVTPVDLGLKNPTYQQICDRAIELGLEKCLREVGPALCLAYSDQPYGEWLRVAMEPDTDSGGDLRVFYVGRDHDGRWLDTYWFVPQGVWGGGCRFVFVRPRK